jgi:hypothetical protein
MKSKKNFILAAAAALAVGTLSSSVMAAAVGVNFIGANSNGGASVTDIAGVVPQANWNNVAGPATTGNTGSGVLVISDTGTPAGTLSWNSPNLWASGQAGANQNGNLMQGYLDNAPGNPSTATITGLPAGITSSPYSVIVYLAGDNGTDNRAGTYTVNGVSQNAREGGPAGDGVFIPASGVTGGNFLVFAGITGNDVNITVTPISGGTPRAPFDGFQVVSGIVPEPASLGFIGLGSLALLARRRRNV